MSVNQAFLCVGLMNIHVTYKNELYVENVSNSCLCVQHGETTVKTHHLEYSEGGILDMDDLLSDLVEDRDRVRTGLMDG